MTISANFPNVQPSLLLDFANAKQLPPQVTFTRATTAAYYDGSTTAKAEQNLMLYSQEFDNAAYAKGNVTVTANSSTAPDGTSTADLVFPSSTGVDRAIGISTIATQVGLPYTISVYAKASGLNFIYFLTYTGSSTPSLCAFFDLSTGAVGQTGSYFTSASIVSVGSGWYRCTATANSNVAGSYPYIGLADANNSGTATASGSNGVLLWGFQLEQRSSATAYTATTSQPITNYIPVLLTAGGGQPRFDHNPTTSESLGLEIERQSTNLHRYSAAFDGTVYNVEAGSYLNNTIVSPSGGITGAAIIEGNTFYTRSTIAITVTTSTEYTYSAYFKKGLRSQVLMEMYTTTNDGTAVFDLVAGTVVGGDVARATITNVGNGWYRCTLKSTTSGTNLSLFSYPAVGGSYSYTHVEGADGIYIWGAQLEQASFVTSYIPTTSAAATRAADSAVMTGSNFSSWFNNSEGTLYVEASPQTLSSNSFGMASLTNISGSNNSISMYYAGGNVVDVESLVNGVSQYTYLIPRGAQPTKVAHGYKVNNSNVALNGTAYTADTVCLVPLVNTLTIGTIYDGGGFPCNGTIRKLAYYPIRVTDAQLAALTS